MTQVYCDATDCAHWKRMECQLDAVSFSQDEGCDDYEDYTAGADYQAVFYMAIKPSQESEYKLKCNGKRFEIAGFVLFTECDDRKGLDNCWFTEERTGIGCPGRLFFDADSLAKIPEALSSAPSVLDLPDFLEKEAAHDE